MPQKLKFLLIPLELPFSEPIFDFFLPQKINRRLIAFFFVFVGFQMVLFVLEKLLSVFWLSRPNVESILTHPQKDAESFDPKPSQ